MKVTAAILKRKGACSVPTEFIEKYPNGTDFTPEFLSWCDEKEDDCWLEWGFRNLIPRRILYEAVTELWRLAILGNPVLSPDILGRGWQPPSDVIRRGLPNNLRYAMDNCVASKGEDWADRREALGTALHSLFHFLCRDSRVSTQFVLCSILNGLGAPKTLVGCANCGTETSVFSSTKLLLQKQDRSKVETLSELVLCVDCSSSNSLTKIASLAWE